METRKKTCSMLEGYEVIFVSVSGVHTEYVLGGYDEVLDYVANQEQAYGVKASEPRLVRIPEKLDDNQSVKRLL